MSIPGKLYIGTSGWNYKDWKQGFYQGVKQKEWLEHYCKYFNAVEVNATFYRLLKPQVYAKWQERTPGDFSFCIKGSRYITHTKRLKEPRESIERQKDNIKPMNNKIPAVVWQLPGSMDKDRERLEIFCQELNKNWSETRHAIEFRHNSWFDEEVADILASSNVANCISDAADWPKWEQVTTDIVYIRLHGNQKTYHSSYSEKELQNWAEKIRGWINEDRSVHIYFDNTDQGAAPDNALQIKELLSLNNFPGQMPK